MAFMFEKLEVSQKAVTFADAACSHELKSKLEEIARMLFGLIKGTRTVMGRRAGSSRIDHVNFGQRSGILE